MTTHFDLFLRPDPSRVVVRPFAPAADAPSAALTTPARAQAIADQVLSLDEATVQIELARVTASMSDRHRHFEKVLLRRYHEVNGSLIASSSASGSQKLLIGAYFCEEYAFEAAALFNPSIVPHPDQSGVPEGSVRFVLSLRGVGEGHVSSITFRTGICAADGRLSVDQPSQFAVSPRTENIPGGAAGDPGVRLLCPEARDLSEIVVYPITEHQRHGIEDLRMVRFVDEDGNATYLGTYTAFSGTGIRQELLRTNDFATFELTALRGEATLNKGMALFPKRIDGRYAMLGRRDHVNIWLSLSADLYQWDDAIQIVAPRFPWEFVQIGNCGAPIEIDEGWLVLTHGVGPVRNYCIGAVLLDKKDPARVLGRLTAPLLRPNQNERYGYVPNIIYSCGAMVHNRILVLPYAVADNFTTCATIPLATLLPLLT